MIQPQQNRELHALLGELGMMDSKAHLVRQHTKGRTSSSKDLSFDEAEALITSLRSERDELIGKMRRKAIHLMCLMGYVTDSQAPDYNRINNFVQTRTGKNNPKNKKLSYLNAKEMRKVLNQITIMYNKTIKGNERAKEDITDNR